MARELEEIRQASPAGTLTLNENVWCVGISAYAAEGVLDTRPSRSTATNRCRSPRAAQPKPLPAPGHAS